MHRDEVPNDIPKLINSTLEGFMWECHPDGEVKSLLIRFSRGDMVLTVKDTFNIEIKLN